MFGEKLGLITKECVFCHKHVAMRVDPEDTARHASGVFVQFAFADRAGVPYLTPAEREMWISGSCSSCWDMRCPTNPLSYS